MRPVIHFQQVALKIFLFKKNDSVVNLFQETAALKPLRKRKNLNFHYVLILNAQLQKLVATDNLL